METIKWYELYNADNLPTDNQVNEFVGAQIWIELGNYLQQTLKVKMKLTYSNCSMNDGIWKGWNVKYTKGGKALCTLYPKRGYFLSLVPIGLKEMDEAEAIVSTCSEYTQSLFARTPIGHTGKSLAFEVRNETILEDLKKLVSIRGIK
jgi:AraC family transcriptional regulator